MKDCNRDYNDFSVVELGIDEISVGLSAIGYGNQIWELSGMTNFCSKEIREYTLSTSYALSSLTQGFQFRSKDDMDLTVRRFVVENKLSLFILRFNKKRLEVECIEMKNVCKFGFRVRKSRGFFFSCDVF